MAERRIKLYDSSCHVNGTCSILENYAKKEGYQVILANDGEQTLFQCQKYHPSIVLLDVMMPKIDGFEVCRKLRSQSDVPIIMITARGEDFEKIICGTWGRRLYCKTLFPWRSYGKGSGCIKAD